MARVTPPGRRVKSPLARLRVDAGWGRLINVDSASATTPSADIAGYQSNQAAMTDLTMSLARSLAGTTVIASIVCPGTTIVPVSRP